MPLFEKKRLSKLFARTLFLAKAGIKILLTEEPKVDKELIKEVASEVAREISGELKRAVRGIKIPVPMNIGIKKRQELRGRKNQ